MVVKVPKCRIRKAGLEGQGSSCLQGYLRQVSYPFWAQFS